VNQSDEQRLVVPTEEQVNVLDIRGIQNMRLLSELILRMVMKLLANRGSCVIQ
jgi:hypothetical protein